MGGQGESSHQRPCWPPRCLRPRAARRGSPKRDRRRSRPSRSASSRDKVRPILETRCLKCHGGGGKVKGGFRIDSRAAVLKGGELGPAIDGDQPEQSLLLQAIRYEELEMPPGGKLPAGEQEVLSRWVQDGLPWGSQPAASVVSPASPPAGPASPRPSPRRGASGRTCRSCARPCRRSRAATGSATRSTRSSSPASKPSGSMPAPEADRVTLIRRLTYDLTGLPPTPRRSTRSSPTGAPTPTNGWSIGCWPRPHYGEHWGRHWLDLVRYAETNGYERDSAKPVRLAVPRLRDRRLQRATSRTTSSSASNWPAI